MNACYKSLEVTFIYVFGVETVTLCVCVEVRQQLARVGPED